MRDRIVISLMVIVMGVSLMAALLPGEAQATNGYFTHGQGAKYRAIGGAGAALYLGPMAQVMNPGASAFSGAGYDLSLFIFNPNREFTVTGDPSGGMGTFGLTPGTVESGSKDFYIPSLAANWYLNDDETMTLGLAVYGQGGMNTDYESEIFNPGGMFTGTSPAGVDLMQMFVSPTFAMTVAERHGFGVSPVMVWQRFEAKGVSAFGDMGFSESPDQLSNNEHDNSFGYGVRAGYLGEWLDFMSVGFTFQSKMVMSEFDEYAGLFAEQGKFDIPASWTAGVAMGFPGMGFAFDVQQILYSGVAAIANPLLPNIQTSLLGSDEGAGFGWEDMTVFKTGAWYLLNSGYMIRAGYSYGSQPIPESEVLFNILAPGVVEHHITVGVSREVGIDRELSFVVTRALSKTVSGPNPLEAPGQQTIDLRMDQWEFGIGLSF